MNDALQHLADFLKSKHLTVPQPRDELLREFALVHGVTLTKHAFTRAVHRLGYETKRVRTSTGLITTIQSTPRVSPLPVLPKREDRRAKPSRFAAAIDFLARNAPATMTLAERQRWRALLGDLRALLGDHSHQPVSLETDNPPAPPDTPVPMPSPEELRAQLDAVKPPPTLTAEQLAEIERLRARYGDQ